MHPSQLNAIQNRITIWKLEWFKLNQGRNISQLLADQVTAQPEAASDTVALPDNSRQQSHSFQKERLSL